MRDYARSASLVSLLTEDDFVDSGVGLDGDIPTVALVGNEISTRCPRTLVYCARYMATSLCNIAGAEHVMMKRHALRDIRLHQKLGDWRQIMRLCVKGTGVSVTLFVGLEPWLWVKCL